MTDKFDPEGEYYGKDYYGMDEPSCENCDYFHEHATYEYPHEASECSLPNHHMDYLKNFPFKKGCKFWKLSRWLDPEENKRFDEWVKKEMDDEKNE